MGRKEEEKGVEAKATLLMRHNQHYLYFYTPLSL